MKSFMYVILTGFLPAYIIGCLIIFYYEGSFNWQIPAKGLIAGICTVPFSLIPAAITMQNKDVAKPVFDKMLLVITSTNIVLVAAVFALFKN